LTGSRIRGGRFRLRPQARELFEATVDGSGGAQKPRTGYGKDNAGRALWAVYGSVRGCIQGHSDLALVVQHMEWQRLGVTVREGPKTMYDGPGVRILSNSMRSDRRTCIHSVMQDANKNEETLSVRDESVCGQKHDRGN
jgi:hypothetical protein